MNAMQFNTRTARAELRTSEREYRASPRPPERYIAPWRPTLGHYVREAVAGILIMALACVFWLAIILGGVTLGDRIEGRHTASPPGAHKTGS